MSEGTLVQVLAGEATWCVVEGDCLEVLPTIPDRAVAHVLSDPPYSDQLYARTRTNKGTGLRPNGKPVSRGELHNANRSPLALASRSIGAIDGILEPVAAHMLRVATRWVLAFHDHETEGWRKEFGDLYVRTGAWVKANPMPQISADRPGAGFEPCTIAHARRTKGKMRWNGGGRAALWTHANAQGPERPDHPCPKPVLLMLDLVSDFTDPGELVLDPFAGSGTTGVACLRLGRRFIGIEKDAKYAAIARERLRAESQGLTLRDARAGQLPMFGETP